MALFRSLMITITTTYLADFIKLHSIQQDQPRMSSFSLSLFALFIEPLAATVQQNRSIKSFQHLLQNITLYFTQMTCLLLQDAHKSRQECFAIIKSFSELSSYSVNWSKSTILLLSVVKGRWKSWHHFFTSTQKMSNISALLYSPSCQGYSV